MSDWQPVAVQRQSHMVTVGSQRGFYGKQRVKVRAEGVPQQQQLPVDRQRRFMCLSADWPIGPLLGHPPVAVQR